MLKSKIISDNKFWKKDTLIIIKLRYTPYQKPWWVRRLFLYVSDKVKMFNVLPVFAGRGWQFFLVQHWSDTRRSCQEKVPNRSGGDPRLVRQHLHAPRKNWWPWGDGLQVRADRSLAGLATNSIYLCLLSYKKSMICPPGWFDSSSGKHFSHPFLPTTPSSPSRTHEGLFGLTRCPSRALDSPRALLPELHRYKDTVRCGALGAEVPGQRQ